MSKKHWKQGRPRFYLKVQGMQGPSVPHDSLESAYKEARRLWELNSRTRRVYVLEVVGAIEAVNVE